jgi:ACR3 family arsenite efflux pump ArsB
MHTSYSTQAHVGRRVALAVFWTIVFIVGVTIGLLVTVPNIREAIQAASSTIASQTFTLSVAVAMVILGLWGITASHRNIKHAVDLIAEVDRARMDTIQLESSRFMQKGK